MAASPRKLLVALLGAVAAGLVGFRLGGAPQTYSIMNAVAGAGALALALAVRRVSAHSVSLAAMVAGPLLVGATLLFGPEIDGVSRWLALGPLRLHAAALIAPMFVVALQLRDGISGTIACILLSGIIAIQPDMAAAIALAGAVSLSLLHRFSRYRALQLLAALAAVGWTISVPDRLAPVPFVEGVLQGQMGLGTMSGWLLAAIVSAALAAAIGMPSLDRDNRHKGGLALSGWFGGLTLASLIGNYPSPLIGYGAAPIIGYGLAIGLIGRDLHPRRRSRQDQF